jgi:iron-regulated transporter 1
VEETGVGNTAKDGKPLNNPAEGKSLLQGHVKGIAFTLVLVLGVLENLSRRANVISIQRDWVPVLAPPLVEKPAKDGWTLVKVDATMTGINLVCELLAPFVISGFLAFAHSMRLAVMTIGCVNGLSIWLEFATARWIAGQFVQLRAAKKARPSEEQEPAEGESSGAHSSHAWYTNPLRPLIAFFQGHIASFKLWMSLDVCLSSLSFCILHTNLLSISSTTVVFLLNSGYSLRLITIAEAVSATFEFASTILTPYLAHRLSPPAPAVWEEIPPEIAPMEEQASEEEAEAQKPAHHNVTWAISRIGAFGITEMFFTLVGLLILLTILATNVSAGPYNPSVHHSDHDIAISNFSRRW